MIGLLFQPAPEHPKVLKKSTGRTGNDPCYPTCQEQKPMLLIAVSFLYSSVNHQPVKVTGESCCTQLSTQRVASPNSFISCHSYLSTAVFHQVALWELADLIKHDLVLFKETKLTACSIL